MDFTNKRCQHVQITKWSQVGACGFYQQKMSTCTNNYKWQSHTSLKHSEISWHDTGCQAALEGTRQEKKREELGLTRKCSGSWEEDGPYRYTISWCSRNKYWSLCGPTAYSCEDARNRATDIIQRFQNKVLRNIVDAPWYIRNDDLRRDLQMEMVTNEIGKFAKKHEERILHHFNVEAIQLLGNSELVWRIKKILLSWCSDH